MAYTDIDDPSAYFQTALFTGNAGTNAITNTGNSDLQPDWVWFKCRSATEHHGLFDSVRGVTKGVYPNLANAEDNLSDTVASFNSDGFTMGADTGSGGAFNGNTKTMVAWQWKETATAGFDIVSYSGNNSTNRQISHSLSAKPDMMLVKCRQAGLWKIYHSSLGATKYLVLSDTAGVVDNNSTWNDTEPTSSNFTLGDDGNVNETGETYINYLFAEKQGYSKFGSYVGNGNADGTFVYTGFKPSFVMVKSTGGESNWQMSDNKRNTFNEVNKHLRANSSGAEFTNYPIDFLSNGFKLRATDTDTNGSGTTYIFMCFASNPFQTSTGVPTTAR